MRFTWVQPEDLLPHELVASRDEGRDVSGVAERWTSAGGSLTPPVSGASPSPASPALRKLASQLLDELDALPAQTPGGEPLWDPDPNGAPLLAELVGGAPSYTHSDRRVPLLTSAWVGRAVGCLLGKPVEKIPREGIREILTAGGQWPLDDYFTAEGLPDEVAARWPWNRRSAPTSLRENIAGMPEDDDLNYPLLALRLLETVGPSFSSADVAQQWLDLLPAGRTFTAERVAYRNLLLGLVPPETARRRNPFREWIGALIRTDVYGWVCPGRPDRAAALAWRDAQVSHVGAGVHGAMWAAALASVAVVASSVEDVLDAALAVIPDGRFADAVRFGRSAAVGNDWESVLDRLYERYGHLHWVHVLNNGALAAAALAYGRGDFTRTICAAVTGGWDTDSVGATVGAVTGALSGVPSRWSAPLRNQLHTTVAGFDGVTFDELAARTVRVRVVVSP